MLDESQQQSIVTRLNRIEGQIRGIRRMVQEPRLCVDILQQLAAAEAALNRISLVVLRFMSSAAFPKGSRAANPSGRGVSPSWSISSTASANSPRRPSRARLTIWLGPRQGATDRHRPGHLRESFARGGLHEGKAGRHHAGVGAGDRNVRRRGVGTDTSGEARIAGRSSTRRRSQSRTSVVRAKLGAAAPRQAKTNNKGEWSINNLAGGMWEIEFAKDGFAHPAHHTRAEARPAHLRASTSCSRPPPADPNAEIQAEVKRAVGAVPEQAGRRRPARSTRTSSRSTRPSISCTSSSAAPTPPKETSTRRIEHIAASPSRRIRPT